MLPRKLLLDVWILGPLLKIVPHQLLSALRLLLSGPIVGSDPSGPGKHFGEVLSLGNAFALIDRHAANRSFL